MLFLGIGIGLVIGVALTIWALRASGTPDRQPHQGEVAQRYGRYLDNRQLYRR